MEVREVSLSPRIRAPNEAGIKRQKEKLKASTDERPSNKPIKIVDPDRETPGKIANPWARPMMKAVK